MKTPLYHMTIQNTRTGNHWEEPLTSIWVSADSPHAKTHEIGWHDAPKGLTAEQVEHYAKGVVLFFNKTLRDGQAPRKYLSSRLAVKTERNA